MSCLNGIISHAAICGLLKTFNTHPFCNCHVMATPNIQKRKTRDRRRKHAVKIAKNLMSHTINQEMLKFLKDNHLFVYAVEKRIEYDNIVGRIDCIFKSHLDKTQLYIIDWKFSRNIPNFIQMDYIIQLNIYMYIMKRINLYSKCTFKLYCFIFSTSGKRLKIFECNHLPEPFIDNLITKTIFK